MDTNVFVSIDYRVHADDLDMFIQRWNKTLIKKSYAYLREKYNIDFGDTIPKVI